jgi:hypothetical protein
VLARRAPALLAAATVVALAGCGGGGDAPGPARSVATTTTAAAAGRPALCAPLRATITGRVADGTASELSGLAASHAQPGVLWTHDDSGSPPRIFAVAPTGRLLAALPVAGAQNVDWEDIAVGPGVGGDAARDALYVADIGDNDRRRDTISVYRVAEPRLAGRPAATAPATRLELRYPDAPHDAEALLVDPRSGALTIVTKSLSGASQIFVAARPAPGAVTTLRAAGSLALGLGQTVTAGSVSADGRTVAVRTYDRAYVWRRRAGEALAATLRRPRCAAGADLLDEGQGEALALTRHGRAMLTVPEGPRPPLRRYAPAPPP